MDLFRAFIERPRNITFESQEEGETLIFVLRKHFITNIPWIFVSLILLLGPLLYMNFSIANPSLFPTEIRNLEKAIIIIWYFVTFIFIIQSFFTWYFNIYIVTDRRIIDVDFAPLFYKKISETTYERLEDSSFSMKSFFETVFNYGDIAIQTAAEQREFDFHSVPNPGRFQDVISDYAASAASRR